MAVLLAPVRRIARAALDLCFPPAARCLVCGHPRLAELPDSLCPACREALEACYIRDGVCVKCLSPVQKGKRCAFCARGGREGLDGMHAAYFHRDEARLLVHRLKYGGCGEAALSLGAGMARSFPWAEYDCLAPVPLHKKRQRARGANQAALLCREISKLSGVPVIDALTRTRRTMTQTRLNAKARQRNVEDAFAATMDVRGMRVLLVDDVRTTGATARACAKALRAAGACKVGLLTATVAGHGKGTERTGA